MVSLHNKYLRYLPTAQVPVVSGITDFLEKESEKGKFVRKKSFF